MTPSYDEALNRLLQLITAETCSDDQKKSTMKDFTSAFVVDMNVVLRQFRSYFHDDDVRRRLDEVLRGDYPIV